MINMKPLPKVTLELCPCMHIFTDARTCYCSTHNIIVFKDNDTTEYDIEATYNHEILHYVLEILEGSVTSIELDYLFKPSSELNGMGLPI